MCLVVEQPVAAADHRPLFAEDVVREPDPRGDVVLVHGVRAGVGELGVVDLLHGDDFQIVAGAKAQCEPVVDPPLVLEETADEVCLHVVLQSAWHTNRQPFGVGAEVRRAVGAVARKRERTVEVVVRHRIGRHELVLHTRLEFMLAPPVRDEPRERVFDLVGVVHARLRGGILLVSVSQIRQGRLQGHLIAAVLVVAGSGKLHVLLREANTECVDLRGAKDGVERADHGLIEIVFLANRRERHVADELVVLRRVLTKPPDSPCVIRVDLVVEPDQGIPHARFGGGRRVQVRPRRDVDRAVVVDDHALEAQEEVCLVTNHRSAHGASRLHLSGLGFGQVVLLDEVALGRELGVLQVAEGAPAELVRALLCHRVDHRPGRAPELRVELVGEHLEFLDRFEGCARLRARALADYVIVVARAVERIVVVARVLPVDVDRVGTERLCADIGHNSRQQADESDVVAIDRRQVDQFAIRDVAAHLLRCGVHDRGFP